MLGMEITIVVTILDHRYVLICEIEITKWSHCEGGTALFSKYRILSQQSVRCITYVLPPSRK